MLCSVFYLNMPFLQTELSIYDLFTGLAGDLSALVEFSSLGPAWVDAGQEAEPYEQT